MGFKRTTEEEFNMYKTLRERGSTYSSIGKAFGRPTGTIQIMTRYDTLADYREAQRNAKKRERNNTPTATPPTTIVTTVKNMDSEILVKLDAIELHLQNQDAKFEVFAELYAWVAKNASIDTKRKWFA